MEVMRLIVFTIFMIYLSKYSIGFSGTIFIKEQLVQISSNAYYINCELHVFCMN